MKNYYTPMMRAGNSNRKEFYIEEFPTINPLRRPHDHFGLVFNTFAEAEKKAHEIIEKNGGSFIGTTPGRNKHRHRGLYKK